MENVNELKAQKNRIDSIIESIEKKITSQNEVILIEEISNLIDGVGDGYRESDYYAPARYYSAISGVKNLRMHGDEITVKIISPRGENLPDEIMVRGKKYKISIIESSKFCSTVDKI